MKQIHCEKKQQQTQTKVNKNTMLMENKMRYQRRTSALSKYPTKRNGKQCAFTIEEFDLHYLCSVNDTGKLKNIFRLFTLTGKGSGGNVNLQDEDFGGRSPLHVACSKGRLSEEIYIFIERILKENKTLMGRIVKNISKLNYSPE